MRIQNRTFIVSGGSSGLGLATVQELIKCNAWVSVLDRLALPEDVLPTTSSTSSSRLLFIQVDIAARSELEEAVEKTMCWVNQTGKVLGGVINCAGMGINELMVNSKGKEHSMDVWDRTISVNLTAAFNLTRLTLKHLSTVQPDEQDGERGVVILTSSSTAYEGPPGQVAYAASKGALSSMALPMARDCARWGIRVVSIAPSSFETPLLQQLSEKVRAGLTRQGVLFPKRYGHPSEFAATVRWILETAYVNGEDIRLSGGGRVPAWL